MSDIRLVQVDAETLRQLRSDRDRYKSDRDDAWARCAAGECDSAELERERAERLRGVVEAVRAHADEWATWASTGRDPYERGYADATTTDAAVLHATLDAALASVPSSGEAESGKHEHVWQRRQNVTTKGTTMPPYEVCTCGAARPAPRMCSLCGHTVSEAMGGWRHDGSANDDDLDASHPIELVPSSGETGERACPSDPSRRCTPDRMCRRCAGPGLTPASPEPTGADAPVVYSEDRCGVCGRVLDCCGGCRCEP